MYDRFLLTRATALPADFSALTRATVQVADVSLPNSEHRARNSVSAGRRERSRTVSRSAANRFVFANAAIVHVVEVSVELVERARFAFERLG